MCTGVYSYFYFTSNVNMAEQTNKSCPRTDPRGTPATQYLELYTLSL